MLPELIDRYQRRIPREDVEEMRITRCPAISRNYRVLESIVLIQDDGTANIRAAIEEHTRKEREIFLAIDLLHLEVEVVEGGSSAKTRPHEVTCEVVYE
jgi:hypothetical protein